MVNGPHDGLVIRAPDDCQELRFPVSVELGYNAAKNGSERVEMIDIKVSVYLRGLHSRDRFYYQGDR